jgi:DNA polymerase V
MISSAIALVDCDCFYASCERFFDPSLRDKPVVVLSNNDGCVVARNQVARAIVPMGAPLFQYERILEAHHAVVFSSNYELYGDMSRRVVNELSGFSPDIEVYSIDESFLEIQETKKSFDYLGREIKEKIQKYVGLPVGVGVAYTKTLAKVANKIAKKSEKAKGVVNLYKSPYVDVALERTKIEDVWNIGRRSTEKLLAHNIKTALQLKYANRRWIKGLLTVTGARTLLELNGVRAMQLELTPPRKKMITRSRSFGEPVETFRDIHNAVSVFLMAAVDEMRKQKLSTRSLQVFAATSRYLPDARSDQFTFRSAYPSNNLFELQEWAHICLDRIFRKGLVYKKAGVTLGALIPDEGVTERLYKSERLQVRYEKLNGAIDEINRKFGRGTIRLAAANVGDWQAKAQMRSPRYTTRVEELMRVM